MASLEGSKIKELRGGFEGEIVLPGDGTYDSGRSIWNAMIDKRPAIIARCGSYVGRRRG